MRTRSMLRGSMWPGLTPSKLATALRAADDGEGDDYLTLAEELEERDPHYAAVLQSRKLAVLGAERSVVEDEDEGVALEHADLVAKLLKTEAFENLLAALLDGLSKGYAVAEIQWHAVDGLWLPRDFVWHDPRLFRYDAETLSKLFIKGPTRLEDKPLDPNRFILFESRIKRGVPLRAGLARLALFCAMAKAYALKDWLAFLEVYGQPVRIGRYPATASEDEVSSLFAAISAIGSNFSAVLPEQLQLELVNAHTGGNDAFLRMAEYIDAQLSKAVLGQTMTTDDGSSLAQAKIHNEVRLDLVEADGRAIAGAINSQLVPLLISLNFGEQARYPTIIIAPERSDDLVALSQALDPMLRAGLRVAASEIRERFRLREPEEGEEVLAAPAPSAAAPGDDVGDGRGLAPEAPAREGFSARALHDASREQEELEALIERERGQWEQQVAPLIEPALEALAGAESEEEAIAKIEEAITKGEDTKLVAALALEGFRARAQGYARGLK
jgi:phage gp29-like protein